MKRKRNEPYNENKKRKIFSFNINKKIVVLTNNENFDKGEKIEIKTQKEFEEILKKNKIGYMSSSSLKCNYPNYITQIIKKRQIPIIKDFNKIKKMIYCPSILEDLQPLTNKNQIDFKLKKNGSYGSEYLFYNKGRKCFSFIEDEFLRIHDNKYSYRIIGSNIKESILNCLKKLFEATNGTLVGILNVFDFNVLTFTFIGYIYKNNEFGFKDIYNFLKNCIFDIEKKFEFLKVTETDFFYLQKFNNFHFYLPKIFETYQKFQHSRFNQILFL